VLNYVDLQVISNTDCASVFGSYIVSSTLCLATPGGKSTCSVSHTETDILLFYLTTILSSVTKVGAEGDPCNTTISDVLRVSV
jgi:hypothetical protein